MARPVAVVSMMFRSVRVLAVLTLEMTVVLVLVMMFVPMFSSLPILIMDVAVRARTVSDGVVLLMLRSVGMLLRIATVIRVPSVG